MKKEPILSLKNPISLDTYDLERAKEIIVRKVCDDFPFATNVELANKLNVAERTIYRFLKDLGIDRTLSNNTSKMINNLTKMGYKIIPPNGK